MFLMLFNFVYRLEGRVEVIVEKHTVGCVAGHRGTLSAFNLPCMLRDRSSVSRCFASFVRGPGGLTPLHPGYLQPLPRVVLLGRMVAAVSRWQTDMLQ